MTAIQNLHDRVAAWSKAGDQAYAHSSLGTRHFSDAVSLVTGLAGAAAGSLIGIGAQVHDDLSPRIETRTDTSGKSHQYIPFLQTASWTAKTAIAGVGVALLWNVYAAVNTLGTVGFSALGGWGAAVGLVAAGAWAAGRGIKHGFVDGWLAGVAGANLGCAKVAGIFHRPAHA